VYGGFWVLFGSHQTFRVGGGALVGGLVLLAAIVQYVRRPSFLRSDPGACVGG
jgi:hypothetical protein